MNRNQLIGRLSERVSSEITNYQDLKFLKQFDVKDYIDIVITTAYMYTRPKKGNKQTTFAEIISAIGHSVRGKLSLPKNSILAARAGAFLLFSFEEMGAIEVKLGAGVSGHQQLLVNLLNDDLLNKLWSTVTIEKSQKLPALKPYADWTTSRHSENNAILVKTGNKDVLGSLHAITHPFIFESINRAQRVGWRVHKRLFEVAKWALRTKTDAFADIWEQTNPEAKITKLREAKAILDIATKLGTAIFYHQYYYDFRGRKYPTSAYLHEQGSDLARGLLLRSDERVIGERGFFWLCINCF